MEYGIWNIDDIQYSTFNILKYKYGRASSTTYSKRNRTARKYS